ncbi:hypothetical protein C7387_2810 [Yokenella regensburgei]|uniref:Uncharacterized protein n=1 Tax=Yokenella regensburgei TaxID=158877 RepID=A0ABX9S0K2_9ENTR|nr:hypothetical protein [Yokenella regensburgei]RKR54644.1 hypothetical protein C7387_2810 [Yokenella regensburgei]VFS25290.1 Uncharacterised protein [Yokenella regensburgei]
MHNSDLPADYEIGVLMTVKEEFVRVIRLSVKTHGLSGTDKE